MKKISSDILKLSALLESSMDIGDACIVKMGNENVEGYIRAVTFTNAKVRYAVRVYLENNVTTTLHNLDSILVEKDEGRASVKFEDADNYS